MPKTVYVGNRIKIIVTDILKEQLDFIQKYVKERGQSQASFYRRAINNLIRDIRIGKEQ